MYATNAIRSGCNAVFDAVSVAAGVFMRHRQLGGDRPNRRNDAYSTYSTIGPYAACITC